MGIIGHSFTTYYKIVYKCDKVFKKITGIFKKYLLLTIEINKRLPYECFSL